MHFFLSTMGKFLTFGPLHAYTFVKKLTVADIHGIWRTLQIHTGLPTDTEKRHGRKKKKKKKKKKSG